MNPVLKIKNYKTVKDLKLELHPITILIGANGSGKTNLLSFFEFLINYSKNDLNNYVNSKGGACSFVYDCNSLLCFEIVFEDSNYEVCLKTFNRDFCFEKEDFFQKNKFQIKSSFSNNSYNGVNFPLTTEKNLQEYSIFQFLNKFQFCSFNEKTPIEILKSLYFEETKNSKINGDSFTVFLFILKNSFELYYNFLVKTIQSIVPYFEDFVLELEEDNSLKLKWKSIHNKKLMTLENFSSGTLRFIILATLFLQPDQGKTIILDNPEIDLNPFALSKLEGLIRSFSKKENNHVLIATNSVSFLNKFELEEIITVNLSKLGFSEFNRLKKEDFQIWLKDYSSGDLWESAIINKGQPF